jgi:hypothetical protein
MDRLGLFQKRPGDIGLLGMRDELDDSFLCQDTLV